jgi:hypothetical protein
VRKKKSFERDERGGESERRRRRKEKAHFTLPSLILWIDSKQASRSSLGAR